MQENAMVSGARRQKVQWLAEPEGRKYNGQWSQKAESTMVSGARRQKEQWVAEPEGRKYNG